MRPKLHIEHFKTRWNPQACESKFYEYKYGDLSGYFSINEYHSYSRYDNTQYFVCFHEQAIAKADDLNEAFRDDPTRTLFSSQHDALELVRGWLPNYLIQLTQ